MCSVVSTFSVNRQDVYKAQVWPLSIVLKNRTRDFLNKIDFFFNSRPNGIAATGDLPEMKNLFVCGGLNFFKSNTPAWCTIISSIARFGCLRISQARCY